MVTRQSCAFEGFQHLCGSTAKAVIVDDDISFRNFLQGQLGLLGFDVAAPRRLDEGLEILDRETDLIVVSADIPGTTGGELANNVRARNPYVALILISGRHVEADIVAALDNGANGYMVKPFSAAEFLARVRAALRHRLRPNTEKALFQIGGLAVDNARRYVTVDGQKIHLTPKEYDCLNLLVQHAGSVVTTSAFMQRMWTDDTSENYLRVLVRSVREKIEPRPTDPSYILTVTGVGYRLQTQGVRRRP